MPRRVFFSFHYEDIWREKLFPAASLNTHITTKESHAANN